MKTTAAVVCGLVCACRTPAGAGFQSAIAGLVIGLSSGSPPWDGELARVGLDQWLESRDYDLQRRFFANARLPALRPSPTFFARADCALA